MRNTAPRSNDRVYDRAGNCIDPWCSGSVGDDRYCEHVRCGYLGVHAAPCVKPHGHFDDCEYSWRVGDRIEINASRLASSNSGTIATIIRRLGAGEVDDEVGPMYAIELHVFADEIGAIN